MLFGLHHRDVVFRNETTNTRYIRGFHPVSQAIGAIHAADVMRYEIAIRLNFFAFVEWVEDGAKRAPPMPPPPHCQFHARLRGKMPISKLAPASIRFPK